LNDGKAVEPRKGMLSPRVEEAEFKRRFRSQFQDPAFEPLHAELDRITEAAWGRLQALEKEPTHA
jgi:hypothetical protein